MRRDGGSVFPAHANTEDPANRRGRLGLSANHPGSWLGRLIFLLVLWGAIPSQVNDKSDEAQQPTSNPFCGADVREEFHWNSIIAARVGERS